MTSMRICERHERAYPSDGQCEWCEPKAVSAGEHSLIDFAREWSELPWLPVVKARLDGDMLRMSVTIPPYPAFVETTVWQALAPADAEQPALSVDCGDAAFDRMMAAEHGRRPAEERALEWRIGTALRVRFRVGYAEIAHVLENKLACVSRAPDGRCVVTAPGWHKPFVFTLDEQ